MCPPSATIARLSELLNQSPDAALSKSQMDHLILEKVGLSVSDELLSSVFRGCDTDHDGTLCIKELAGFVDSIGQPTQTERSLSIRQQAVTSIIVWNLAMFICAVGSTMVLSVRALLDAAGRDKTDYYSAAAIMLAVGCYVFVEFAREDVGEELRLIEACKDKIVSFSKKIDLLNSVANGDDAGTGGLDRDLEMTPLELFELFQKGGLYIPYEIFEKIFDEIDVNGSGLLSFSEVKAYAETREEQGKLPPVSFQVEIAKNCLRSLAFWVGWGWVMASVLWVVAAYSGDSSSLDGVVHLNGVASAMFLLCAAFQHYIHYHDTSKRLDWAEKLEHSFLFLAAEMEAKANNVVETGKEVVQDSIPTRNAVRELFEDLDDLGGENEDGGDETLDFIELHDELTRAGFVVELGILRELFLHADGVSGDGRMRTEESVEWISDLQSNHSASEKRIHILKTMVRSLRFWMACSQMVGGAALVAGTYSSSARAANSWFLIASIVWFVPACKNFFEKIESMGDSFDSLAISKLALKKALQART